MSHKTIGIMQPYFFPYIGYWQLINAVDEYVIYDDVNYIKGGWINRNRILSGTDAAYINVQLSKASPNKKINEIEIFDDPRLKKKLYLTIENSYKKAPYFDEVYPFLKEIFSGMSGDLVGFLYKSINEICVYLGINTSIVLSSNLSKDMALDAENRVIDICKNLSGNTYINAIGGQELYSKEHFKNSGLELKFLKTGDVKYKQYGESFVPNLSIIDVMMFNTKAQIHDLLEDYTLI